MARARSRRELILTRSADVECRVVALRGLRSHARRSPRGRDDARGRRHERIARRLWVAAPAHDGTLRNPLRDARAGLRPSTTKSGGVELPPRAISQFPTSAKALGCGGSAGVVSTRQHRLVPGDQLTRRGPGRPQILRAVPTDGKRGDAVESGFELGGGSRWAYAERPASARSGTSCARRFRARDALARSRGAVASPMKSGGVPSNAIPSSRPALQRLAAFGARPASPEDREAWTQTRATRTASRASCAAASRGRRVRRAG